MDRRQAYRKIAIFTQIKAFAGNQDSDIVDIASIDFLQTTQI